ncbi:glycoside hydrolase superfamily [Obelidium mucronatum]|nr:glycoside hydrolase superfamily [Obelidium mucronatum]
MIRHSVLHCLFWTKAVVAMAIGLFCMLWFSWRIYDLHSRATPAFFDGLQPIEITNEDGSARQDCAYNPKSGFARLEPQVPGQMLGFSLDWSYDTPTRIVDLLGGFRPTVFNAYMEFSPLFTGFYDQSMLNWYGSEAGRVGASLEITMLMAAPVRSYTNEHFDALSKGLATINSAYGVPIYLRFGHEMNGPWSTYGFDPTGFIPCFQGMAISLRKFTNMTAMVWGPNIGFGYPFGSSGGIPLPAEGTANFIAMDTDKNGKIDKFDDPYGPYWPGAEYVDWVGLSLYYYPADEDKNYKVPDGFFEGYMTGTGHNQDPSDVWKTNYNFYKRYSSPEGFNKPMMLPETGAPFLISVPGDPKAVTSGVIHDQWYASVFNQTVVQKYPNLKIAVQFEELKFMATLWRDWRVLNSTSSTTAFLAGLKTWGSKLTQASKLTYLCNGEIKAA